MAANDGAKKKVEKLDRYRTCEDIVRRQMDEEEAVAEGRV